MSGPISLWALIKANEALLKDAEAQLRHFAATGEAGHWTIEFHHSRGNSEIMAKLVIPPKQHKLKLPLGS